MLGLISSVHPNLHMHRICTLLLILYVQSVHVGLGWLEYSHCPRLGFHVWQAGNTDRSSIRDWRF